MRIQTSRGVVVLNVTLADVPLLHLLQGHCPSLKVELASGDLMALSEFRFDDRKSLTELNKDTLPIVSDGGNSMR
jgi:hypothetical protein